MHVAITGASSGIGEAIAREFARVPGAKLTLVARRRELLEKLASSTNVPCHVVPRDLSDPATAAGWLDDAEKALGPIDVLVNNAGVELVACTAEMDPERGEQLLRLNLLSPLRITRALLPRMIERRSGTIVDVASVAALAGPCGFDWYAASKAGLAAASETLRAEVRPAGVHVVTVYPGPVHSDMAVSAMSGLEPSFWASRTPWGTSDVLARRVRRAVERRRARVIYPRFYALARWFPPLARWVTDLTSPMPKRSANGVASSAARHAAPAPGTAPTPG